MPAAPSTVTMVDAVPDDAEAILALQRLAYQSEARRYDNWAIPPLVETLDSVREHIERHVVLKAIIDDRLVGSVRGVVAGDTCEVGRLIVDPAMQRRGIGSALLTAIEGRFRDVGAFELFTGSLSEDNLRLYRRHGYAFLREEPLPTGVSLIYLRKPGGRGNPSP
jgi:GNAT superfamily N-acetyltransferase